MEPATAAGATSAPAAARGEASLGAAVAALVDDVRGLVSDAADVVAAESQVALRRALVMAVSALSTALLGSLAVVALLAAMASELVSRGLSLAAALLCVALLCALLGMFLWGIVTRISRQASFANSRRLLRGNS
jgi:hypothetical protein